MKPRLLLALLAGTALAALLAPAAEAAAPRVVKLRAGVDNAVKFDVSQITAAPGETITVVLTNASTLPKVVMGHDWVLLTKGADPVAFANAAVADAANGYVPSRMKDKIIAFIALLGPGESGETTFQVPGEPGDYTFLCTFPGHYQIGMKGTLVVKP